MKEGVPAAFVAHYEAFLGQSGTTTPFDSDNLFMNKVDPGHAFDIIKNVTAQEVKDTMFSIGNDKSPGPDGYTACFFKESWDIVANDVTCVIQFTNVNLLKELNHTIIALIPKIKESIKVLISQNQSAFVPGRRISDNILLTQELMHNYHLDRGPPRQGDPLSPYLFTLVMEVFTLMLRRKVRDSDGFVYDRYCADLEIINLCFADDLFIFAHGDPYFANVIMDAMEEFKDASGLIPSLPKSTAYFCNVLNHTKLSILQILPFEEGRCRSKVLDLFSLL
ncbi:hypothetical protein Tco_1309732 [Tanacetum coccineum]